MQDTWKWKAWGTLIAVLISIYILTPSFFNLTGKAEQVSEPEETPSGLAGLFPKKGINLGLDLRGGLYLEMDVDLKEALKNRVDVILTEIERNIDKTQFPDVKLNRDLVTNRVHAAVPAEKRNDFLRYVRDYFGDIFEQVEPVPGIQNPGLELKLTDTYANHLKEMTLRQAEEAVRNRIDRFGVAEASISRQGDNRIIVELPGIKDPDRVIEIIRKTGLLEFKMVDESVDAKTLNDLVREAREKNKIPEGYGKEAVDRINADLQGKIPQDSEVLFEVERDTVTKEIINGMPYLVKRRADVTGDMLQSAQVGITNNEPHVSISFNKIGTKNFGEVTKANVNKQFAIILDGMIFSAPRIEEPIMNGQARITLGFGTYQTLLKEAEDLSLLLREGALPASLTMATKTVIGPSLGQDSIRKGLYSILIAALIVIVFMIFYYKWGGVLADVALVLNVLFIFAILALFQAALSLPGLAGIVLTLGMAVDANVIIFERMREERRLGKTARSIVESGYGNAMSAIVDSNLTTLISGIVLYQFGTGPIKGFATTLIIGILTTLFTAIVVTRIVYDYFIYKKKISHLSI